MTSKPLTDLYLVLPKKLISIIHLLSCNQQSLLNFFYYFIMYLISGLRFLLSGLPILGSGLGSRISGLRFLNSELRLLISGLRFLTSGLRVLCGSLLFVLWLLPIWGLVKQDENYKEEHKNAYASKHRLTCTRSLLFHLSFTLTSSHSPSNSITNTH